MLPAAMAAALALTAPGPAGPCDLSTAAHRGPIADLAFTSDGRTLVSVDTTGTVVRRDLAAGTPARIVRLGPFPTHAAPQFAVAPGGRLVAVGSSSDLPRVHDAVTGAVVATLPRPLPDADAWVPAFSGDGARVAFGYDRGHGSPHVGPAAVPVWNVAAGRAAGTVELPIPPGGIVVTRVALSADGSALAAVITPAAGRRGSGTELGVWDVASGKRLAARLVSDDPTTTVAFLADDRGVQVYRAAEFAVWEPAADRWRPAVPRPGESFGPPVPGPDGRTFVAPAGMTARPDRGAVPWYAVFETATMRERPDERRPAVAFAARFDWWTTAVRPDGRAVAIARGDRMWLSDPAATDGPAADAAALWAALAGPAAEAGAAIRALVRRPDAALALVREKLPPAVAPPAATTAALVQQLDAPAFTDREAARVQLAGVARLVEPELRAAHAAATSPEQKERLARLLATTEKLSPDELRQVRMVEVLERIGAPRAAAVVRKLASGAENAVLTREAKRTLARLEK